MKRTVALIIVALTTVALACPGGGPPSTHNPNPTAMTSPDHGHSPAEHKDHKAAGKVHVADDGTKFDPPVSKDRIPDEAWACVMGKVHYASMKKGNGKCPLCGMKLVQHAAHQK